mmetsp:Transcript_114229/g.369414  ORF Transcript_114229/g.369414 Transcript_114229/m.369414 type:complete len:630 (+) Transcript_114229:175-2064(+)
MAFLRAAVCAALAWPAVGVQGSECGVGAKACSAVLSHEDASLSFLQRAQAQIGSAASRTKAAAGKCVATKAISMAGGGFLSLADFTGAVSGLLTGLQASGQEANLETLFAKFDTFSAVSGGSWTTSLLMYSASFQEMVEASAQSPNPVGTAFNDDFIHPVLNVQEDTSMAGTASGLLSCLWKVFVPMSLGQLGSRTDPDPASLLAELQRQQQLPSSTMSPWALQMLAELLILIQNGQVSWLGLVQKLLSRGGGIDAALPMGTKAANKWAHGKLSIQSATAVGPAGYDIYSAEDFQDNVTKVQLYSTSKASITYSAAPSSTEVHAKIPVMFSIIIGAGESAKSPLPFCSSTDCNGYTLKYEANGEAVVGAPTLTFKDIFGPAFEESAGMVPISSAIAASSAFNGWDGVTSAIGAEQGCISLAAWTTGAKDGKSFVEADSIRNHFFEESVAQEGGIQSMALKAATAGLNPLIDGGYADVTGIANAVAAGASSVVAFISCYTGPDFSTLALFKGTLHPGSRIFNEPSVEEVAKQWDSFTAIPARAGSQFLQKIVYGTISAVTAANKHFGIEAGRSITLDLISIETANITIGLVEEGYSYNSFYQYGDLVGEIVQTLAENPEATQALLQKFFL